LRAAEPQARVTADEVVQIQNQIFDLVSIELPQFDQFL
jgi:hypothetical protein